MSKRVKLQQRVGPVVFVGQFVRKVYCVRSFALVVERSDLWVGRQGAEERFASCFTVLSCANAGPAMNVWSRDVTRRHL